MRAALLQRCHTIVEYLSVDTATIFDRYVPLINTNTTLELTKLFNLLSGMIGVEFDGAAVNKQYKTLYTVSKGEMSMFLTWQDLPESILFIVLFYFLSFFETSSNHYLFIILSCFILPNIYSLNHVTDAEMESAFKICREIKDTFGYGISSIPVNNAGNCVAVQDLILIMQAVKR